MISIFWIISITQVSRNCKRNTTRRLRVPLRMLQVCSSWPDPSTAAGAFLCSFVQQEGQDWWVARTSHSALTCWGEMLGTKTREGSAGLDAPNLPSHSMTCKHVLKHSSSAQVLDSVLIRSVTTQQLLRASAPGGHICPASTHLVPICAT